MIEKLIVMFCGFVMGFLFWCALVHWKQKEYPEIAYIIIGVIFIIIAVFN